jgi:hypothetical protein
MNSASIPQSTAGQTLTPNFNGLARVYRWMELFTFGPWLQRCRLAFLADLAPCRHAIVLGDGDGRFTAELLNCNRSLRIDAVDLSSAMLNALLRRAGLDTDRIHTHCADARTWSPARLPADPSPNPPYDLIATHFFLDCLTGEEVGGLANRLRPHLASGALWVVSEFAIPESRFGRLVARPLVSLLYLVFGFLTGLAIRSLPNHRSALRGAGFVLSRSRTWLGGLLVSELWTAGPEPAIEIELREF